MRNRTTYNNFGLAFAKEWGELRTRKDLLGQPLQANNLARSFDPLIQVAGTYAHALPDAQQGAADRLAAVLHGR